MENDLIVGDDDEERRSRGGGFGCYSGGERVG